jgi:hypothetical protein
MVLNARRLFFAEIAWIADESFFKMRVSECGLGNAWQALEFGGVLRAEPRHDYPANIVEKFKRDLLWNKRKPLYLRIHPLLPPDQENSYATTQMLLRSVSGKVGVEIQGVQKGVLRFQVKDREEKVDSRKSDKS